MNKNIRIGILGGLAIVVLGVAVYMAFVLVGNGSGSVMAGRNYEIVMPTGYPDREPDLMSLAVQVKDQSILVKPVIKSQGGQEDYPEIEVVVTSSTEIYLDETDRNHPTVVNGEFHWTISPFELGQIKEGYVLSVWGSRRGDRWIADTIIVYVIPTEEAPQKP